MERKKEEDCYTIFEHQMQIIHKETESLQTLLLSPSPFPSPDAFAMFTRLQKEDHAQKQKLLQNTLSSFVTPLERKDIIRLTNSLSSLCGSLCETIHILSVCSSAKWNANTSNYTSLLSSCCSQLSQILHRLPEKKQLSLLLSQNEALYQYVNTARQIYAANFQKLYQETKDARQLFAQYCIHHSLLTVFECYESCSEILEEIFCDF